MTTAKDEIHAVLNKLQQIVPTFKSRQSQYTMIARVATLFGRARTPHDDGVYPHILEVDAPCGTGKSLGYLIPAIVMSRRLKKRLVVSSSTVALQEQLTGSDLPLLSKCFDNALSFVIAKGRTRYVCPYRLEHGAADAGQYSLLDQDQNNLVDSNEGIKRDEVVITLHNRFKSKEWDGSKDSLGEIAVDEPTWRSISTDRQGCSGSTCPNISECPFYKARAGMETADVIVTNHDLLLADISLGGGVILPKAENTIFAIDEGHHFPEKAVQKFSEYHSVRNSVSLAERMLDFFNGHFPVHVDDNDRRMINEYAKLLMTSMQDLTDVLDQATWSAERDIMRFPFGDVPEAFYTFGANITAAASFMFGVLEKVNESLMTCKSEGRHAPEVLDRYINDISQLTVRLESINDVWTLMVSDTPEKAPPIAKWVKHLDSGDYFICASPISAASMLKNKFFEHAHAVVLASATLTTLGKFNLFNHKSGLGFMMDRVESLQLDSPFDFERQGKLIIPTMNSDPKNVREHTREVIALIPAYIPTDFNEGVLAIFTSHKQMQDVYANIHPRIRKNVLLQGQLTKDELIRQHKRRVDEGRLSIIFGVSGLAEGIDLPGPYCSKVLIGKLPFGVPTNPIEAAEAEWLESVGRNAFAEITVPSAGIKLAQAVGRLIRTESDYGEVIVFDNRLANTNYGKMLQKGLPNLPIFTEQHAA